MNNLFDNNSGANFSRNGQHRYRLWRIWDRSLPIAMCIGLNPSTANADKNDATIRILIVMLKKLGYGGLYMMNCWSYITSKPRELLANVTAIDFCINNAGLKAAAEECEDIIFAWGDFKIIKQTGRDKELIELFPNAKCFGKNKSGTPFHPLAMMPRNGRDPNNPKLHDYL